MPWWVAVAPFVVGMQLGILVGVVVTAALVSASRRPPRG